VPAACHLQLQDVAARLGPGLRRQRASPGQQRRRAAQAHGVAARHEAAGGDLIAQVDDHVDHGSGVCRAGSHAQRQDQAPKQHRHHRLHTATADKRRPPMSSGQAAAPIQG
jgi:hypothetical protein